MTSLEVSSSVANPSNTSLAAPTGMASLAAPSCTAAEISKMTSLAAPSSTAAEISSMASLTAPSSTAAEISGMDFDVDDEGSSNTDGEEGLSVGVWGKMMQDEDNIEATIEGMQKEGLVGRIDDIDGADDAAIDDADEVFGEDPEPTLDDAPDPDPSSSSSRSKSTTTCAVESSRRGSSSSSGSGATPAPAGGDSRGAHRSSSSSGRSSSNSNSHNYSGSSSSSSSSSSGGSGSHRSHSRGGVKQSCYARLVGKRRQSAPPLPEDPGTSTSVFGWARDRVLGLVAGESAEERSTRLRLSWYKQVLQAELGVVEKARQHFGQHGRDLAIEFEMQELQLQKWGLLNILPAFRMQAWSRVSRSALLEDMAGVAEKILRLRLQRSQDVITLYANDTRGNRKHPLGSYSAFCLEPDKVMAKEPALQQLGHRLTRMDKVCTVSLHVFKTMLPELESRTFAQRKHMLGDVLSRYAQLVAITEPASLEATMGWPEFCEWYALRHQDMAELEREYGNFVEDEREREGRLFRRWCTLTLLADDSGAGAEESLSAVNSQGAVKPPKMSPRSIMAFIRHFAVNVIAG